jgi:hypothetical protein
MLHCLYYFLNLVLYTNACAGHKDYVLQLPDIVSVYHANHFYKFNKCALYHGWIVSFSHLCLSIQLFSCSFELKYYIKDVFWDFVPCSTSSKQWFGDCIVSSGALRSIGFHSCITVEHSYSSLSSEAIHSPKRHFELVLHGTKSHKQSTDESIPEDSVLRPLKIVRYFSFPYMCYTVTPRKHIQNAEKMLICPLYTHTPSDSLRIFWRNIKLCCPTEGILNECENSKITQGR